VVVDQLTFTVKSIYLKEVLMVEMEVVVVTLSYAEIKTTGLYFT
jgi:hypothetical protein